MAEIIRPPAKVATAVPDIATNISSGVTEWGAPGAPGASVMPARVTRTSIPRSVTSRVRWRRIPSPFAISPSVSGVTSQGALKIVDDMEENGYVDRRPDPDDARAKRLSLTERGNAALAAARAFHRRFESNLASRVGPARVTSGRKMLEEMVQRRRRLGKAPALRPV